MLNSETKKIEINSLKLNELKKSIPDFFFTSSIPKSLSFFIFDFSIILLLTFVALKIDSYFFYPVYWFLQGTFFWALFVVGHDCGHGSFSNLTWLNNFIGHLSHTPLLVPFHGWRISHRTHHNNTGNPDKDESWYPLSESEYKSMNSLAKFLRFKIQLLVFPLYLFVRSSKRDGSHFLPSSQLFSPVDKWNIITSTVWFTFMLFFLIYIGFQFGLLFLLKIYIVPYFIFVIWLSLVTFLHHTDKNIPWYRNKEWTYLKGALSTIDRTYGIFESIHHNIGTHVLHHIFPKIPHYNLVEANEYLKKEIGDNYHFNNEPILNSFLESYIECQFISDEGDVVYYTK